jgi:ABC-type amino acid transport substrate-binding protein
MISHGELGRVAWRKSVRSETSGCVSVAVVRGFAAVRDSKDQGTQVLVLALPAFRDLVRSIKAGEYDA